MDYEQIKNLINDIGNSNIDEVNLELPDGIKISVRKNSTQIKEVISEDKSKNSKVSDKVIINAIKEEINENCKIVTSPMVGNFYTKSSPNANPFVKVGDIVKKGQVLCIIEAMKLMNEIESEYDGKIIEICVKDDSMVEYGQPIFKII